MSVETVENLKRELTDKYVVVDANLPELKRFDGYTGQVKTVNMNGRALVEFEAWANIGWYDIDVDYLRVVPKPEADATTGKHEAKPAAKAAPAKPAAATAPAAPGEKKLSPLEMARMQGAAKPAGDKPAAAPAATGAKQSTADILAAARASKSAAAAAPAVAPAAEAAAPAVEAPAKAAAATKVATSAPALKAGQRPSVAEMIAWCRAHDAK